MTHRNTIPIFLGKKERLHDPTHKLAFTRMSARCLERWASLLRGCGATGVIVACACALALAGSPQAHERLHRGGAGSGHSCAITLLDAGKCIKGIESHAKPLIARAAMVVPVAKFPIPSLIWVPTLFLEACRCEHGPPALS